MKYYYYFWLQLIPNLFFFFCKYDRTKLSMYANMYDQSTSLSSQNKVLEPLGRSNNLTAPGLNGSGCGLVTASVHHSISAWCAGTVITQHDWLWVRLGDEWSFSQVVPVASIFLSRRRHFVIGARLLSLCSDHRRAPTVCRFHVNSAASLQHWKCLCPLVVVQLLLLECTSCGTAGCRTMHEFGSVLRRTLPMSSSAGEYCKPVTGVFLR